MAGIHRDIRKYFKHSISGTKKEEIPKTGTITKPTETNQTGQQSENNESTIRSTSSNKDSITKPKHTPVHPRTTTTKRTKTARHFTKSTNIINLSKYQLSKEEDRLLNK